MAKNKSKEFRAEIKAPDSFENFWETVGSWFDAHKKAVLIVMCIIFTVALGIVYQQSVQHKKNIAAMDALIEMQKDFNSLESSEKLKKTQEFLSQYKSSSLAGMGYMYQGAVYYQQQDLSKAKEAYQNAQAKLSKTDKSLAMEALANIAVQENNIEDAQRLFKELLNHKNNYLKDYHAWNLIALYQQSGDKVNFEESCMNFEANYPESSYKDKVKSYCMANQQ